MGRSMPQKCEHGRTLDHGDFGDEWEPYRDLCPECMPADKCAELTESYRLANRGWLEPYHREWYAEHDDKTADRVSVATWGYGVDLVAELAEVTAERDRLRAASEIAEAMVAALDHASWCSFVIWRGDCSCGIDELQAHIAAATKPEVTP